MNGTENDLTDLNVKVPGEKGKELTILKKRHVLILFISLSISFSSLYAQNVGLYGFGGYGLGRGGILLGSSETYDSGWEMIELKNHYFNSGEGFRFGGGIQVEFSRHLALRVFGEYSSRPQLTETDRYLAYGNQDQHVYNAHVLSFQSLLLFAPDWNRVSPYAGFGGGFFLSSLTMHSVIWWGDTYWDEFEIENSFHPALGFAGVLGLQIPCTNFMTVFMEANIQMAAYTIEKMEFVQYEMDGVDVLDDQDWDPNTPGNQQTVTFEKDNPDKNSPWVMPGSNVNIRVGIVVNFIKL